MHFQTTHQRADFMHKYNVKKTTIPYTKAHSFEQVYKSPDVNTSHYKLKLFTSLLLICVNFCIVYT